MKTTKILFLLQTVLMALSVAFAVPPIFMPPDESGLSLLLFTAGAACFLSAAAVAASNALRALFVGLKKIRASEPPEDLTKSTLLFKILQIPLYCANYVCWALLSAALLNPFMMIALPFVIVSGTVLTYILLLGTGVPNVMFAVGSLCGKKAGKGRLIAAVVFHFLFVLDLPGAIILYITAKNEKKA